MTTQELITKLQSCPPDATVYFEIDGDDYEIDTVEDAGSVVAEDAYGNGTIPCVTLKSI